MHILEPVEQNGVLPSFFPVDLKIDMHSPDDLAKLLAEIMLDKSIPENRTIIELTGPQTYSSSDVANSFSKILDRKVTAQPIHKEHNGRKRYYRPALQIIPQ